MGPEELYKYGDVYETNTDKEYKGLGRFSLEKQNLKGDIIFLWKRKIPRFSIIFLYSRITLKDHTIETIDLPPCFLFQYSSSSSQTGIKEITINSVQCYAR